jgi:hypothetical protein
MSFDSQAVSTDSEASLHLAMDWWEKCEEGHTECRSDVEEWLPTRLIDVDNLRLCSTAQMSKDPAPRYIALSHRWGSTPGDVFRLVSSNESQLMEKLLMDDLSQVFCDAIHFTKRSGIGFLWVDSLCTYCLCAKYMRGKH